MSKISTYPSADTPLQLSDRLIGTEAIRPIPSRTPLATKNFSLGELLQLFSSNFPAASLQAVLNTGNTATQNITLTGTISATLIKPNNIEDTSGSQGTVFQFLSKGVSSINWVDLPVDNLQAVLDAGNTATQNVTIIGNITSTKIIPGNIQDDTSGIGTTGQVLSKTASGIRWITNPTILTAGLADVLSVGNTATNNITLIGDITVTNARITGAIYDSNNSSGTSGQILSSTATGTDWIDSVSPNPSALTKVDDTNVTLTLGGTPATALLENVSLTLGWTGTLDDSRISSSAVWNAKQAAISLTTIGTGAATFIGNTLNIPTPPTATFTSLTTTGTSGASTLLLGVLNVPTYTLAGLGGQPQLNGTGFVKVSGTTVSYDNSTYYLASNPSGFTSNLGTVTSVAALTLGTSGTDLSSTIATGTTTPVITLNVPTASAVNRGVLSSIDWTAFNNKQNTITLTTIGTGAATLIGATLNIPTPPSATFTSLTTTGASGSSTLIAGVLNVPTYTLSGLGGVSTSRTITINGTTQDLSADRAWSVGTVTSVGLSMPSAFSVASSPITGSGILAVTGAGVASQYIRGDGTLANFPTSSGGGASYSYYLNGSVSQGTIGGVAYKQMNSVPVIGAGTDFTINANGYIAQFITNAGDPNKVSIPGGNWNFETYFSASSSGGTPRFYIELYKYNGTTFTLISSSSATPEFITGGTNIDLYFTALAIPPTTLLVTDRLAVRFYVIHSGRTITMHTEDTHLSQIITTFSTGISALNGLTSQAQYFATGVSGTDFNISSITDTHTFNLPTASSTKRGALSSTDWTIFNSKQNALTNPITGTGTPNYVPKFTGTSALGNSLIYDNGTQIGIGFSLPLSTNALFGVNGKILSTDYSLWDGSDYGQVIGESTSVLNIGSLDGYWSNVDLYSSGNFVMRLSNASNVLIGTDVDNGVDKLQVNGSILSTSDSSFNGVRVGRGGGNIATNTILGVNAGYSNVVANYNVAVGSEALYTASAQYSTYVSNVMDSCADHDDGYYGSIDIGNGVYIYIEISDGTPVDYGIDFAPAANLNFIGYVSNMLVGGSCDLEVSISTAVTSPDRNTAIGCQSLKYNVSGADSVAIGYRAGSHSSGGVGTVGYLANSVLIGSFAKTLYGYATEEIVIGYNATGLGNFSTLIGSSNTQKTAIKGRLLLGTTADNGSNILQAVGTVKIDSSATASATINAVTAANATSYYATHPTTLTNQAYGLVRSAGNINGYNTKMHIMATQGTQNIQGLTIPTAEMGLASNNKYNVWLFACPAAQGASQINSRLQVGYDQFLPNVADTNTLSVGGTGYFTSTVSATGYITISDRSLKDIVSQDGDTIRFTWKDKQDDKVHIGYVAQEIQKTYPDQVHTDDNGVLSVNYIEVLVAKIQQLENRIKQLENK